MSSLHENFENEFDAKLKAHGKLMSNARLDLLKDLLKDISDLDNISQALGLIHNKIEIEKIIQKANNYE